MNLQKQTIKDYAKNGGTITVSDMVDVKQQSFNAKKYIGFDDHINTNYAVNGWFDVSYKNQSIIFKNIPFKTYDDLDKFIMDCKELTLSANDTTNYLKIIAGEFFNDAQECINKLLNMKQSNGYEFIDQHSVHIATKNLPMNIRKFINDNRNNLAEFV